MSTPTPQPHVEPSADESAVRALYHSLLRSWNMRDAVAFAAHFTEDGSIIGFDGSAVDGRAEIAREMGDIFSSHQTPTYVQVVRSVRFLCDGVALLCGIAGMPSLATGLINPTLNSMQTLIATWRDNSWYVEHFQNTPAQFHGRPDEVARMTEELQRTLGG